MNVGIIEDHVLFGDVLQKICETECKARVVLRTESGISGLALVIKIQPELLLLDLGLPDIDGLALAQAVTLRAPAMRLIIITAHDEASTIAQLRGIKIAAFISKRTSRFDELKQQIVRAMLSYSGPARVPSSDPDANLVLKILSDYEQAILRLIGRGWSDAEIASSMGVASATAQSRRRDIMRKLNIHSTPKLMQFAIKQGFTWIEHINQLSSP